MDEPEHAHAQLGDGSRFTTRLAAFRLSSPESLPERCGDVAGDAAERLFGCLPAQATPAVGTYVDTITVTVTF